MMRRTLCFLEKLVIVESPNKVIKVEGLLSDPKVVPDWSFKSDSLRKLGSGPEKAIAMATTGHFMSLKELTWTPQPIKAKPDADDDFPPNGVLASFSLEWEIMPGRKIQDTVSHYLEEKAGNLSEIIIATDPDREGELIAVHALNLIKSMFPQLNVPFTRAYIHSITADGIRTAMKERQEAFDYNLANAAEARHAMDRIFGFLGSSVVRFANPQMRSIGRVQTPALILINEREDKIANFLAAHKPTFQVQAMATFPAKNGTAFSQVVNIKPDRVAGAVEWESMDSVKELAARWKLDTCRGFHVKGTPAVVGNTSEPPEPFTMATLIAKANRQLHLSSEEASSCLQDLFQMGHITYPRTDSSRIEDAVMPLIYEAVKAEYGKDMVYPLENRKGNATGKKKSAKKEAMEGNVEDAHEAIRPTDIRVTAEQLGKSIASNTKLVYELIRRNTLAAFMIPMKTERVSAQIGFTGGNGESLSFQLEGKHTVEPGWSTAFRMGSGKASQALAENQIESEGLENGAAEVVPRISDEEFKAITNLPEVLGGSGGRRGAPPPTVKLGTHHVQEHRVSPPLAYSEGGLIEELKNNGVGRPSTYPMIVKTLLARNYITVNKGRCETTPVGRMLVETSKTTFPSIVDIGFTSSFENKLDRVAKPSQRGSSFLQQHRNLSEADFVLSSFVSRFLNYVTDATRTQRGNITERSLTIKHDQQKADGQEADSDKAFQDNVARERQRTMALVPDLLDNSKNYRTFTALQNSLNDYLRRNFPPSPVTQWAPRTYAPRKKESKYTSYTSYSKRKSYAASKSSRSSSSASKGSRKK